MSSRELVGTRGAGGVLPSEVDVLVVGAGFSGIAASVQLARLGFDHVVIEKADDVGGTWRDNCYPGCRCDVPSHLYSFSFAPNPNWTSSYAAQPEILSYLRQVAAEQKVYPRCHFCTELLDARFDDATARWHVETSRGTVRAKVLLAGFGLLSAPSIPAIRGLESFGGTLVHSAAWQEGERFAGKKVAVVGTGASAVQIVPQLQPGVERLHVFQRTPPWVLPHRNRPISELERRLYRHLPPAQQLARVGAYWLRELFAYGLCREPRRLETVRKLGLAHLAAQVEDAALREALTPDYTPGCKRITLSDDYYPALCADNAELVTSPIERIDPSGLTTRDGKRRELDVIVLATGFRVTDHPATTRICNGAGLSLADSWSGGGMQAYLGATVAGFPNLFLLAGPNTGIGHTSLVLMVEAQLRYVAAALEAMRQRGAATVEVTEAAQARFVAAVARRLEHTVWQTGHCTSWYLDDNGRATTLWPDFTWRFVLDSRRFDTGSHRFSWTRPGTVGAIRQVRAPERLVAPSTSDEPVA